MESCTKLTALATRLVVAIFLTASLVVASGCGSGAREDNPPPRAQPQPQPEPQPDVDSWYPFSVYAQRDYGLGSISVECYTFYEDGQVELHHNGQVTDSGYYDGGEIAWDTSGNVSSVETDGADLVINGLRTVGIGTCTP